MKLFILLALLGSKVHAEIYRTAYEQRVSDLISQGYPECEDVFKSDDYTRCIDEDGYLLDKALNNISDEDNL